MIFFLSLNAHVHNFTMVSAPYRRFKKYWRRQKKENLTVVIQSGMNSIATLAGQYTEHGKPAILDFCRVAKSLKNIQ